MSVECKAGFKLTEAGEIPEDWEVYRILETLRIANGQVDPRKEPHRSMVLVAPDHIEGKTGRLLEKRTADDQKAISGKYVFKAGDIVYSKIRPYLRKAILADFGGLCSADMYPLTPEKNVSGGFMLAVLLGNDFSRYAESVSLRSGMPKINREEMAGYCFAMPPHIEQCAIASSLSDMDALIGGLDQLIAKKRDIKQAAMQQLLTGQTRLPGFSGEWEVKRLGDVASLLKGSSLSKGDIAIDGPNKCILYGELFTIYSRVIQSVHSRTVSCDGTPSKSGDVLLPGSTTTTGIDLACASALLEDGVLLGGDINIIRPIDSYAYNSEFLANYLTSISANDIAERAQGITIIHLYGRDLKSLEVRMPAIDEQSAIAAVIESMSTEITFLEERCYKAKSLKQGMMQQLLTGKIRLSHAGEK